MDKVINKNNFRKSMISILSCIVIIAMVLFSGCSGEKGDKGENGLDGSKWYYGTETPTVSIGQIGDFYLETDSGDIWSFVDANGWQLISNIKGSQGETGLSNYVWIKYSVEMPNSNEDMIDTISNYIGIYNGTSNTAPSDYTQYTWYKIKGETGEQGVPGENGTSIYVGYDGYIWQGNNRLNFKIEAEKDASIAEDTLLLYGNDYFIEKEVSLNNPVALMGNYFPLTKKTGYSGTEVVEISVYVKEPGTLKIGTASVESIVNARTNGTELNPTFNVINEFEVTAGLNRLSVDVQVAETDTIVLGGNATIYAFEEVNGVDEYGFYTVCDKTVNSELFEQTNNIKDKLAIAVKVSISTFVESYKLILDGEYNKTSDAVYMNRVINASNYPYITGNYQLLSNKTVTKIEVYAYETTPNAQFTVNVVSYENVNMGSQSCLPVHTYYINLENAVTGWNTVVLEEPIVLENNQTLSWGNTIDTFKFGYSMSSTGSLLEPTLYKSNGSAAYTEDVWLPVKVYTTEMLEQEWSFSEHIAELKEKEENERVNLIISEKLENKLISILGDSISTCEGVSDNVVYNTTLASNESRYFADDINHDSTEATIELSSVNETYWMQIINEFNAELLVNNSWRGKKLTDSISRATELHKDTEESDVAPDIVIIMLGTNDVQSGTDVNTAITAYNLILTSIQEAYPNVDIFVGGLLNYSENSLISDYNTAFKTMCTELGIGFIDFYNCGINTSNKTTYLADSLHPNALGFNLMAAQAIKDIINYYKGN